MTTTSLPSPSAGALASSKRIASLDGIRGLSIWTVLIAHAWDHFASKWHSFALVRQVTSPLASFGVNIFFIISGFLITYLLLKEEQNTGSIRLGRFYQRRAMRILPAFLLYTAVILGFGHASVPQITYAFTFTTSYFFQEAYKPLQQLWTLSVEEQFYLLWPLCMLLGSRFARRACWSVFLLAPALRLILLHTHRYALIHGAPAQADMIAAGCLLAFYHSRVREAVRVHLLSTPRFLLAALLTSAFTLACYRFGVVSCLGFASLAIAVVVAAAIERQDAILNRGPLVWCGLLSYSLYLWQQPLLVLHGPFDKPYVRLPLVFLAGWLSYRFVEQPVLAWFSQPSTPVRASIPMDEPLFSEAHATRLVEPASPPS